MRFLPVQEPTNTWAVFDTTVDAPADFAGICLIGLPRDRAEWLAARANQDELARRSWNCRLSSPEPEHAVVSIRQKWVTPAGEIPMMDEERMAAALAARNQEADISGVFDVTSKADAAIGSRRLGEAIQFVANAPIVGYDVRAAMVRYGAFGNPSLRATDCARLWEKFGEALLRL
jgi:hypothetical protein